MKISKDSARRRSESARKPGAILKGQHTKSYSQPLTMVFSRDWVDKTKLESCEDRVGCVVPRKLLKEQTLGSLG